MNLFFTRYAGSQEETAGGSGLPPGPHPKGHEATINSKIVLFDHPAVKGRELLEKGGYLPVTCHALYMKLAGCDFEKVSLEQIVHLDNPGQEHFVTKDPDVYPYTINKDPELTEEKELTPDQMLKLAGLNAQQFYLIQKEESGEDRVLAFLSGEPFRMHCSGLHFITGEWLEEVDVEEYGKHCKPVPPARRYKVKVDKGKFTSNSHLIKTEDLIKFIYPSNPSNYNLVKFYSNTPKPVPIPYTSIVDLTEKCLLRFVVQPKTQDDGEKPGFTLPEQDADFLDNMAFRWEAIHENNYLWLLLHDYPVPAGYNVNTCTLALLIPPLYPATEIDMGYFYPALSMVGGKAIRSTTAQPISQKQFQRWSRHRRPGEWKLGVDCVATHLTLVNNWMENELNR